jgi:hypothetical protein
MSKTLRTAALVVGVVAIGLATYGAALGPLAAGASGAAGGLAGLGIGASVAALASATGAISGNECIAASMSARR